MGSQEGNVAVFIPARGGSKSIPLKNIALLAGRPLIYWTAKACSDSQRVESVFVATDSDAIRRCVEALNLPKVRCIGRSEETATDIASSESALLEFARAQGSAHMALVQATSPLLTMQDVDGAIGKYFSSGADSLLTVVRTKRFLWKEKDGFAEPINYDPRRRPRRQEWPGQLVENGALYLTSRVRLLETGCRISGRTAVYEMSEESYFEIDEPSDRLVVEGLLMARLACWGDVAAAATGLRALAVDVDGTLTDGGMYYGEAGELMKRFDTRDAFGMNLLRRRGWRLVIVTGEDSPIVLARARKLGVEDVFVGVSDKVACVERFLADHHLEWTALAYVGDDLNDLDVLKRAGFSACPADAAPEVRAAVHYVCRRPGGHGAVREVCDFLLASLPA